MTTAEIQELFAEAACFNCFGQGDTSDLLKLGLWARIANGASEAVTQFVTCAGITDATQIAALTTLVANAMSHGWWSKCDLIYPFVGGTSQAHSCNLKAPGTFNITWNGTVTHDANGITGDGLTGYGDTDYLPSSISPSRLNDFHFSIYARNQPTGTYFGCRESTSRRIWYGSGNGLNSQLSVNSSLSTSASAPNGSRIASRTIAANFLYVADTNQTIAFPSTSVPAYKLFVLGYNLTGSPAINAAVNLAGLSVGSGLNQSASEALASDWQTFQTALGRQV